jgi:hypothetical protein
VIDVARDPEGVRMALEEIFEEDFMRARIEREAAGASPETRARMESRLPARTLSPGYYRFAQHLFHLDAQRKAGIVFVCGDLAAFEVEGLLALDRARGEFERRHPACSSCGARQENRFSPECCGCGVKFRRKGQ